MPVTNANKKTVDVPFFEAMNFSQFATQFIGCTTTSEGGDNRYIYAVLTSMNFVRYDTYSDTYQVLSSAPVSFNNVTTMRYTKHRGFHGRVISATGSSVQIGGLRSGVLSGYEMEILSGTGAGQKRTITLSNETIHDSGVVTAVSVNGFMTDSTKKWRVNQWAGYSVSFTFGAGGTQGVRRILYNDATTLYFSDANLQPYDPWGAAPASVNISATAGSQNHYTITSQTFTLSSNWTVSPDSTSFFTIRSGGIYAVSGLPAAPFFSLSYYDIASDLWYTKTTPQGLFLASLGVDISIDRPNTTNSPLLTNAGAISGGARTLTDAGLTLANDRYSNFRVKITGGTGVGQNRRIVANTATTFTVAKPWATNPDSTSTYEIFPDFDRLWLVGGGNSSMFAYSPENDLWMQGQLFDDGIANAMAVTLKGWNPINVTGGARLAAGVTAVNSVPTAGGTNYVVGDVLTCSVGGSGAQVTVTSVSPGGIVTGIELTNTGTATGFTTGTGRATTGGTGTGCTIEITSVGSTTAVNLSQNHFFRRGDVVTISGTTEAAYNAAHTIIGVPGLTTICIATAATGNAGQAQAQGTTTIVDSTKNWTTNEHVGRLVHLCVAGTGPTSQIRWITANTATSLTVATITAATTTSKYAIYDAKAFGCDTQRRPENEAPSGYATGGSTTTLVDSSKNWVVNQWAGYLFRIEAGTGFASGRISIISNTATTLTFAAQAFTPDATTKYEIADAWGLATAGTTITLTEGTTKNWTVNQWAGKRIRICAGTAVGNEYSVTSNTSTAHAFSGATAPDTTSAYAILGIPQRSTGIELVWACGGSDAARRGRYMYLPRGGGTSQVDIYDITTGRWGYGQLWQPQSVAFNFGTSYSYDGVDTIYICVSTSTQVARVYAMDVTTGRVEPFGQTTQIGGTAHLGNYLEYVMSPDGVPFLYYMHNASTAVSRAMVF